MISGSSHSLRRTRFSLFLRRGPSSAPIEQYGLAGHKTTMGDLAATLAVPASLGRPVVDRTGLNGVYNFSLEGFAPLTGGADDTRPSFFTAIVEQLGIKLEATKGPVEVLVIDQAARPSEN